MPSYPYNYIPSESMLAVIQKQEQKQEQAILDLIQEQKKYSPLIERASTLRISNQDLKEVICNLIGWIEARQKEMGYRREPEFYQGLCALYDYFNKNSSSEDFDFGDVMNFVTNDLIEKIIRFGLRTWQDSSPGEVVKNSRDFLDASSYGYVMVMKNLLDRLTTELDPLTKNEDARFYVPMFGLQNFIKNPAAEKSLYDRLEGATICVILFNPIVQVCFLLCSFYLLGKWLLELCFGTPKMHSKASDSEWVLNQVFMLKSLMDNDIVLNGRVLKHAFRLELPIFFSGKVNSFSEAYQTKMLPIQSSWRCLLEAINSSENKADIESFFNAFYACISVDNNPSACSYKTYSTSECLDQDFDYFSCCLGVFTEYCNRDVESFKAVILSIQNLESRFEFMKSLLKLNKTYEEGFFNGYLCGHQQMHPCKQKSSRSSYSNFVSVFFGCSPDHRPVAEPMGFGWYCLDEDFTEHNKGILSFNSLEEFSAADIVRRKHGSSAQIMRAQISPPSQN